MYGLVEQFLLLEGSHLNTSLASKWEVHLLLSYLLPNIRLFLAFCLDFRLLVDGVNLWVCQIRFSLLFEKASYPLHPSLLCLNKLRLFFCHLVQNHFRDPVHLTLLLLLLLLLLINSRVPFVE